MRRISDCVRAILSEDSFAAEAIQKSLLNLSAYAKQIRFLVEEQTNKPASVSTIVVALSRLVSEVQSQPSFHPKVQISRVSITTSLSDLTYEKTEQTTSKLANINSAIIDPKEFFSVTEGMQEITIICSQSVKPKLMHFFAVEPRISIDDLVAVSVRYSLDYNEVPNVIYSLISAVANKHINMIEIASSYREFSFIVRKNDMEKTVRALDLYTRQ